MDDMKNKLDAFVLELRQSNERWRDRMVSAGYPYEEARYWAHCIDEVYDEVRRALTIIIDLYEDIDPAETPDYLYSAVGNFIKDIIAPEISDYMKRLSEATKDFVSDEEE